MKYAIQLLQNLGAVAILALLLASFSQAQQSGTSTGARRGPSDALQLELRRRAEREMIDRALAARPPGDSSRSSRVNLAEFRTDFLSLQVVNNQLMKTASRDGAPVLKLIGKSVGEIRKVAQRLKENLALPKAAEGAQQAKAELEPGLEQLRSSLLTLDTLILEFVSNPVFKSAKVVDAQLSAKARRNLDEIISLSGQLRKSCEKLNLATGK